MKKDGLKVVIPTADEINGRLFWASDLAMACGVKSREFFYDKKNGGIHYKSKEFHELNSTMNYAYAFTSTVVCQKRNKSYYDELVSDYPYDYVYDFRMNVVYPDNDEQGQIKSTNRVFRAGNHSFGIPVKFENPADVGMTVEKEQKDIGIIKIGDKVLTLPRLYAGNFMSQKLESLYVQGKLQQTGSFSVDSFSACYNGDSLYNATNNEPIILETLPRFIYQGVEYVRKPLANAQMVERYYPGSKRPKYENGRFDDGTIAEPDKPCWFKCEPIRAIENEDGSILCMNVLFPAQCEVERKFEETVQSVLQQPQYQTMVKNGEEVIKFNIPTENLSIGKFLNQVFLPELLQSAGIEINSNQQNTKQDFGREA